MAVRFLDSFDTYDTSQMLRKWTAQFNGTIAAIDPRNGSQHLHLAAANIMSLTLDAQATWIFGSGIQWASLPGSWVEVIVLEDNGTSQVQLGLNNSGTLEVRRNGSAVSGGESVNAISVETWYFVEIKATISNSIAADSCQVYVNGELWLTVATGQDLQASGNASANKLIVRASVTTYFDDLYLCDGTGSKNNDILGECRVEALLPSGNGSTNDFTGSDADSIDNYLHVDEVPADDDVTYVEDSTPANQDLYAFDDLSATPVAIFAVQANIIAKKDDAGARSAMALIRSGGTTYDGDTHALTQGSYENHMSIIEDDPDTASAWDEAGINAAEFGLETV